jgi:hypothetical protein
LNTSRRNDASSWKSHNSSTLILNMQWFAHIESASRCSVSVRLQKERTTEGNIGQVCRKYTHFPIHTSYQRCFRTRQTPAPLVFIACSAPSRAFFLSGGSSAADTALHCWLQFRSTAICAVASAAT